jgi:hypothetical protein
MDLSNPGAVVEIKLDKPRKLVFDMNTFAAFEEKTGKFFLDVVADIVEAAPPGQPVRPLEVLRKVSMADLRALVWAAVHTYDLQGEPHWPLTLTQVGRYITIQNLPEILNAVLRGQAESSPQTDEVGESLGPVEDLMPAGPVVIPPPKGANGGENSGPPADTT